MYSTKIRGQLDEWRRRRLVEVSRDVNRMRRLKRENFNQRLADIAGNMRGTWGVLGEVLRGERWGIPRAHG